MERRNFLKGLAALLVVPKAFASISNPISRFKHKTYKVRFVISKEMIEDDALYPPQEEIRKAIRKGMFQAQEHLAKSLLSEWEDA